MSGEAKGLEGKPGAPLVPQNEASLNHIVKDEGKSETKTSDMSLFSNKNEIIGSKTSENSTPSTDLGALPIFRCSLGSLQCHGPII